MKEYIEREAAIALSKDIIVPQASGVAYKHRCIDPQDIRDIPAADVVEVRHSCWVYDGYGEFHCHDCKMIWHISEGAIDDLRYCPNCGAKMDGGADDA